MSFEILCIGDIHLGRRASGIPADLSDHGVDPGALSPRAAWAAAVELAQSRGVRAVVLLGDVVDADRHYMEVWGQLFDRVRALVEAGIEVVAIAGNHDVDALPRLARQIRGCKLLGKGGAWETHVLSDAAGAELRLVGWSFPRTHVDASPLGTFPALEPSEAPTLGLLHGDLDATASRYAPFTRRELESTPCHAWLLGHQHKPTLGGAGRPLGYLGSLTPLDPSETGPHGPWILEVDGPRIARLEQVALAPLRWETRKIAVDGTDGEFDVMLVREIREAAETEGARFGDALAVGLRIELVGRSARHRELRNWLAQEPKPWKRARAPIEGRLYFVESVVDHSLPELDLEGLARGSDVPGLLARKLLHLSHAGSPQAQTLVRLARQRMDALRDRAPWSALGAAPARDDEVLGFLQRAAIDALEELLLQKEELP
jgi:DNA repair protein SbcD/Mre11